MAKYQRFINDELWKLPEPLPGRHPVGASHWCSLARFAGSISQISDLLAAAGGGLKVFGAISNAGFCQCSMRMERWTGRGFFRRQLCFGQKRRAAVGSTKGVKGAK
jgi:hypothetical protein